MVRLATRFTSVLVLALCVTAALLAEKAEEKAVPPSPRLFRVIVPVADIEQAAEFYTKLLAIEGRRISPGRHYFDAGDVILALFDPRADGDDFDARPNPDHIYFALPDLDALYHRARQSNAQWVEGKIETRPWGERSFYLKDPFGNPLCFVDERTVFSGR